MYGDQFGEFVCGYWDLKGLRIPTVRRQTSWLFTNMAEDLNSGLPLTNSAGGQNET